MEFMGNGYSIHIKNDIHTNNYQPTTNIHTYEISVHTRLFFIVVNVQRP